MSYPQQSLLELGVIQTGSTPLTTEASYWGGDFPFVTPGELDQDRPVTVTPRTLSEDGALQSRVLQADAVMICCIGSLGKIGIAGRPVVTNQQINSIQFDPKKIWPKYGYYACKRLKPTLLSMAPATTIPIVSKSKFGQLEIPVPPLEQQRRIAAILDHADALRVKRLEALAQLEILKQSIFVEMFGDPIVNSKHLPTVLLSNCTEAIQIGPFGTQLHEEDYVEGGIPLVNPTHIKAGKIFPDMSLTVSTDKYKELFNYCLKQGDLILGRRGEMGRCAVVTKREEGWLCGTGSLFLRPIKNLLDSTYLELVISSPSMRRHLNNVAQGVTMANLNKTIVGSLPIPLPPMDRQLNLLSRLNVIDAIKTANEKSLEETEFLFTSLQHLAFRGGL